MALTPQQRVLEAIVRKRLPGQVEQQSPGAKDDALCRWVLGPDADQLRNKGRNLEKYQPKVIGTSDQGECSFSL